ncbi:MULTISPECIES: ACT domain-containing protein [Haloferax]|uniref:ACT domain-containing protein n=1 Tax=Haloferax marinum TaxID=2666143 RepID=A0A6A8G7K1_9EURY|nr:MULTISPECIES: ACT domain-containing protein [Haloferax]KAB1197997.1 ACT domain-containing protein [Haloferax sp. CBA1150]MRW97064.1 ACT domain-containing protein [Haloferax marinum]
MDPTEFLDGGTVTVSEETYTVYKTEHPESSAFATIRDENETTVVAEAGTVDDANVVESEDGWKRLTFEMVLPFELFGFLAAVATALAEEDISIFALSAYSTDHVLVKERDVPAATAKLEELGCRVAQRE